MTFMNTILKTLTRTPYIGVQGIFSCKIIIHAFFDIWIMDNCTFNTEKLRMYH